MGRKRRACDRGVGGLVSNWAPRPAKGAGPASANVTLAQVRRCDLITKRAPKPRPGDDQSSGCLARTDMELTYPPPMAAIGPTLPTWAPRQVGSYLGYTGRNANIVAEAALDPHLTFSATTRERIILHFSREPHARHILRVPVANGYRGLAACGSG